MLGLRQGNGVIAGFDFSSYDAMNLSELQAQTLPRNIYFAYLRAAHGLLEDDESFGGIRADCDSVSIVNGAYFFVMPNQDVDKQIALFKTKVQNVLPGNLPPCLDFEWTKRTDKQGHVLVPEYWDQINAADRVPLIKSFMQKAESALKVIPAFDTHPLFWHDYITQPNPGVDLSFLARYPLWLVDVAGSAAIPRPWTKADIIQNHIGEDAPPGSPWYETLDQDFCNGTVNDLLALTYPGFTLSMSPNPPISAIVRDCQVKLNELNINVGTADGRFGAKTKAGLQQFQTSQALNATGQIDIPTLKKLLP
jgi:hypothetical protein